MVLAGAANSHIFNIAPGFNGSSVSSVISGTGSITKVGSGTLSLSATNTFNGATNINAGTVVLSAPTATVGSVVLTGGNNAVSGSVLRGVNNSTAGAISFTAPGGAVWPGTVTTAAALNTTETLNAASADFSNSGKLAVMVNPAGPFMQALSLSGQLNTDATSGLSSAYPAGHYTNSFTVLSTTAIATATVAFNVLPAQNSNISGYTNEFNVSYFNGGTLVATNPSPGATIGAFSSVVVSFNGGVTPVKIEGFKADVQGAGVLVSWKAISEFQNAGFNVYRREMQESAVRGQGSEWVRVNSALIAGRITNAGEKQYAFYDWAVPGVYEYKLESLSIGGVHETHEFRAGPVVHDRSGLLTPQSIDAAAASLNADLNAIRSNDLSAKFTLAASVMGQSLPAGIGRQGRQDRVASLVRNADGALAMPAALVSMDRNGSLIAARAVSQANPTPAAASLEPATVSVRWFAASPVSASGTFSGAKVLYSTPGVLMIPRASVPAGFDLDHVSVQREGVTVTPLALTQDGLVVFGQGYQDDYTDKDALFLRSINGKTAAGQVAQSQDLFSPGQAVNTETPASVTSAYHDVYFDYNYRPYDFTPWFSSQYLTADAVTGTTQSFSIGTPSASSGAATLTVTLWSLTQSGAAGPDHALQVLVNGQPAGQAEWNGGDKMLQLTFQIPSGALTAGSNQIDLVTPPVAGVDSQICFLNSMSIAYTRTLDGSNPVAVINSGSTPMVFEVTGVPGATAWVVDTRYPDRAALAPFETQPAGDGTYTLRFTANAGGTGQYLVVPMGQENLPVSITKTQVRPVKAAAYWAVGPSQFSAGVQPLLAQRSKEGIKGTFVDQEQLFDYYNYGRYGPAGIQNAVRSARPQYLLLLGRTTYDYKNYSGLNVDPLCPTFLVSTSFWSQTTSDSTFGDMGRGYSEVAVGRLPVNNPAELNSAVKHVLNYAGAPASGARVHLVADQVDPAVANFAAEADSLAQSFPDMAWQPNYLGVTYQSSPEVTAAMTAAASGGADWIDVHWPRQRVAAGQIRAAHSGCEYSASLDGRCGLHTIDLHRQLGGGERGCVQQHRPAGADAAARRHLRQRGNIHIHEFGLRRRIHAPIVEERERRNRGLRADALGQRADAGAAMGGGPGTGLLQRFEQDRANLRRSGDARLRKESTAGGKSRLRHANSAGDVLNATRIVTKTAKII